MEVGDQISKGFVPWLDGFWLFNKVSIYLSQVGEVTRLGGVTRLSI